MEMPFHSGYGYGTGDWLWSIFSTALFVVLVTMAILLLIRLLSGGRRQGPGMVSGPAWPVAGPGPGHGPGAQSAERVLAERYARGEISEEEYRNRLEVLRQTGFAAGDTGPGGTGPAGSAHTGSAYGGNAYGGSAYGGSAHTAGAYGGAWAQPVPDAHPIPEPQPTPRPQWQTTDPAVAASAGSSKTSSSDAPEEPTKEVG
jgi:putative membrane protein